MKYIEDGKSVMRGDKTGVQCANAAEMRLYTIFRLFCPPLPPSLSEWVEFNIPLDT